MDKKRKTEKKRVIGGKDFFILILAVCMVLLFVVFLLYVNKQQSFQQQQLQNISQQEGTENMFVSAKEQDLCINEICKRGWIEIYNRNETEADISSYQVLCGGAQVTLPEGAKIGRGGFWAVDLTVESGCTVELYSEDGALYDSVYVPQLEGEESFARKEDGGDSFGYLGSSREQSNGTAEPIVKDFLYFDVQSGFYNQDLQVEVVAPEGHQVYYTLDGSKPTLESEKYSGGIHISNRTIEDNVYSAFNNLSIRTSFTPRDKVEKCTVIRAASFDAEGKWGQEVTACYFVANGNKSMYQNLPVISICAQPEKLFGYEEGLYTSGKVYEDALASDTAGSTSANYYMDYTAEAYVQYFGADKQFKAEAAGLLQTYDDGFLDFVQKSLLLSVGGKRFLLNAGGNDDSLKIRDLFLHGIMQDTEAKMIEIQPCIVFLEGEYWGVYLLQRDWDEKALESQYGIPAGNLACVVGGRSKVPENQPLYDELYGYVVNTDLSKEAAYRQLEQMMDIQSFLDCYCAHIYIADSNWMSGNDVAFRTISAEGKATVDDGKWRFVFAGADYGMGSLPLSSPSINTYLRPAIAKDAFVNSLMQNPEFKQRYLQTMQKYAEEIFTEDKVEAGLEDLSVIYKKGVQASHSRFGGVLSDAAYRNGIENIKAFFQKRKEYILKYTQEFANAPKLENPSQTKTEEEPETLSQTKPEEEPKTQPEIPLENEGE